MEWDLMPALLSARRNRWGHVAGQAARYRNLLDPLTHPLALPPPLPALVP